MVDVRGVVPAPPGVTLGLCAGDGQRGYLPPFDPHGLVPVFSERVPTVFVCMKSTQGTDWSVPPVQPVAPAVGASGGLVTIPNSLRTYVNELLPQSRGVL